MRSLVQRWTWVHFSSPNPSHPSHTYVKCRHQYCRTHVFTCPLFHNYVSSKIKGRECIYVIPVYCSGTKKKQNFRVKNNLRLKCEILRAVKSMSFTVFSYNATVLLIQPNPSQVLENATQPNRTHAHLWFSCCFSHHSTSDLSRNCGKNIHKAWLFSRY